MSDRPALSIVVIGRNEGERLVRCLKSVATMRPIGGPIEIIYVDSASTDGSAARAAQFGAKVISVAPARPCVAAGRNAGWKAAAAPVVMFLDGDTVLAPDFAADSLAEFEDPRVAVVWGHRREIDPHASIFGRVLDLDWIYPPGRSDFCGGDALVRRSVLEEVSGFDELLIAGEEPEMCWRIRSLGYTILHVDRAMVWHDLAMTRCWQYWRRAMRTGYAYAEVSARFRSTDSPLWSRESDRNLIHGAAMIALLLGGPVLSIILRSPVPVVAAIALIVALALRTSARHRWRSPELTTVLLYGLHSHLQQIPILCGQIKSRLDRRSGRVSQPIEYKQLLR